MQLHVCHGKRMVEIGKCAFRDGVTGKSVREIGSNGGQFGLNPSMFVTLSNHRPSQSKVSCHCSIRSEDNQDT